METEIGMELLKAFLFFACGVFFTALIAAYTFHRIDKKPSRLEPQGFWGHGKIETELRRRWNVNLGNRN